jgi:uncharacterized membrane protein YhaH (DUF805 family)
MRIRLADLWSWQGTIDRGPYLLIGLLGFALKHNLDRLIATHLFGRRWDIFNYWLPPTEAARLASLPAEEQRFFAALLLLALPFIWVGVVLTTRRLRAAGLPLWLVVVFFLPVINLAFFLSLALLPSRPSKGDAGRKTRGRVGALFDRWIPRSAVGSAAMSLLLTLPFGILFTRFGTATLNQYGWGLFVGLPFALGFAAVLLYGYHQPRSYAGCLLVSWFSVLFTALGIFALAVEGLICIVMAAPMAVVLAAIGGSLGYLIQSRPWSHAETPSALLLMVFFVPSLMGMEAVSPPERPLFAVRTAIEIDAPREAVWRRVVAFTQLPSPTDWFFRLGIAYPIRAEIHGTGVGAERYCLFSTGAFVEPIEVWDEPRLLRFSVESNPSPMQEWTLYAQLDPPHLDDFLVSRRGQFLLTSLSDGRTRLEGTTWYHHNMWPAGYWKLWSDWIIHRIHLRVLRHVRSLVEHDLNRAPR